ncbi:DNA-binding GntR family transcriptional regulator [Crossiella equi]|uniref:DNA-binding GntR family transcriptional regulator n=1 Tax=Crossiella equi TaxID=130796 RepID=A0ABS5AAY0_9PSEU|nr:GntR family transcriptional regulator [Crossiella equi]MBP2473733.1 DNA-binding GntR family transcriptional regulator [Crossiella equi]
MQYISRVDRSLLRDRALAAIRHAIVVGDLAPGEIIRDVDLAERLGLSRTPVREALARLADEGLVETKPHSYTRVTAVDPVVVRDAQVVVQAMQAVAARLAVPRLGAAEIGAMRQANEVFAAALAAEDALAALAADEAFHDVAVNACGNGAVADTIGRYLPVLHRVVLLRFDSSAARESVRMHEEIVSACAAGDAARAGALVEANWATLVAHQDGSAS